MADTTQSQPGHRWLMVILFISILLRVAAAFSLGDHVGPLPGTYDQVSYDRLAQRLLDGYGFTFDKLWWPYTQPGEPTAHWSYLYTLYLAGVYGLVGYHPLVARLIQAVLVGALMPWLVYRLGSRHFGQQVGLVASGVMACYAYFVYYAATLMTENFYIIGILWVLYIAGELGQAGESPSATREKGLLLGLALGATVLLRQVFLLFIPVLFLWLLWRSYRYQTKPGWAGVIANKNEEFGGTPSRDRGLATNLRNKPVVLMTGILLTATIVLLLAIAPWTVRNYLAFNRFVLLNTNAGFAFYWSNHPIHGQNYPADLPDWAAYVRLIPPELLSLDEAELDQALLKRGLDFIRDAPRRYLMLSISRFDEYFMFWPSSESGLISNVSRVLSFGLFWPLMAYGLISHVRRSFSSEILILYLFIIIYSGIHLLSWALIRYRLPVDAVLIIFAGAALVEIQMKLAQRQAKIQKIQIPKAEI
jgi:4-amino-4-deoxy-L-arabinose transferase-like glycosyltransferase